ncbi:RES family NAD+ phosphorylase [Streptacidiphilus neutrinimicus]|uniref:RES family NAD+ phosphorylase n=1 Tax=Streptacidiphilus neutrinimicus TaxID=105420 RepID=UPI0005AB8AD1|nr:RES family NAD+ phosphorylase [Streptacidiphilus neutrinimicus]
MTSSAPRSKKQINRLGETFPKAQIEPAETLFRSHSESNGALYYCTDGSCRFDPPRNMKTEYGCCCTATAPETAVLENLAGAPVISTTWAESHRVSEVTPKTTHGVADLTAPKSVGLWGIGAEIQVGTIRRQTQSWGRAFRKAGFDGVRHRSRRANMSGADCVAFYGRPGEHDDRLQCGEPKPINSHLLREIERTFGVPHFPPVPLFD